MLMHGTNMASASTATSWHALSVGGEIFLVFLIGYYWFTNHDLQYAQTMAFTGVVYAFVRIAIIRDFDGIGMFQNPWIVFSLLFAAVMQLFIIYCPEVNDFFGLARLDWRAWSVMAILAVWSTVTGIWVSRWVESWAGHVIEPVDGKACEMPPTQDINGHA